jgi:hypothetical protein
MSPWLRRLGALLLAWADRLEAVRPDETEPWPDVQPLHERIFQLRTRIHCGYY